MWNIVVIYAEIITQLNAMPDIEKRKRTCFYRCAVFSCVELATQNPQCSLDLEKAVGKAYKKITEKGGAICRIVNENKYYEMFDMSEGYKAMNSGGHAGAIYITREGDQVPASSKVGGALT